MFSGETSRIVAVAMRELADSVRRRVSIAATGARFTSTLVDPEAAGGALSAATAGGEERAAGAGKSRSKPAARDLAQGPALFDGSPHPNYELWVGLETHAQISSASKLFSRASTTASQRAPPNSRAAFLDAALPGALPRLNRACVEQTVRTGLALGGEVSLESRFDRKHYFYCDMPLGYQITQQATALVVGGSVDLANALPAGAPPRTVRISRIQLEQDSGKNLHDVRPGRSHVDLNRAGSALMEVVTEPDIRSAEEAAAYVRKLRALLRHIGAGSGNMEDGALRCDVNVTVRRRAPPGPMTQRVEIKNLNSIRGIVRAINFEALRQVRALEAGEGVERETRSFNARSGETVRLRAKEDLLDYRFLPEPDLPVLRLSPAFVAAARASLPELPDALHARFTGSFGLSAKEAAFLVQEPGAAAYFQGLIGWDASAQAAALPPKQCASWMLSELVGRLKRRRAAVGAAAVAAEEDGDGGGGLLADSPVSSARLAALVRMVLEGEVSGKQGKELLDAMVAGEGLPQGKAGAGEGEGQGKGEGPSPQALARAKGMLLDSDPVRIGQLCDTIVSLYPDEVQQYVRDGRKQFFGFLVGQVIKLSKQPPADEGSASAGEANPKEAARVLTEKLRAIAPA